MNSPILKNLFVVVLVLLFIGESQGQTPTIDLQADGFIVKAVDHTSVIAPNEGMIVYDGPSKSFLYFNGTEWKSLSIGVFENFNGLVRNTGNHGIDDFVFGSDLLPNNIQDTLMFFDISKGAFRAGRTTYTDWDEVNIGEFSSAFGDGNRVSGKGSTSFGEDNLCSGDGAISGGKNGDVTGNYSMSWGSGNMVSSINAASFGTANNLTGNASLCAGASNNLNGVSGGAIGSGLTANGASGVVVGRYNVPLVAPQSSNAFITPLTPMFIVGNGTASEPSNALSVQYNGNITINESYILPLVDGTINQVLTTDGNGVTSWQDISTGSSSSDFLNIGFNAFTPTDGIAAFEWATGTSQPYLYHFPGQGSNEARFMANLELPDGVDITEVHFNIVDNSGTNDLLLELMSMNLSTGTINSVTSINTSGLTSSTSVQNVVLNVSATTVDNQNQMYFISIKENSADPFAWMDNTLGISCVSVKYE